MGVVERRVGIYNTEDMLGKHNRNDNEVRKWDLRRKELKELTFSIEDWQSVTL